MQCERLVDIHLYRFQVGALLPLDELLSVGKERFCELGCPKVYHYGDIVFCHSLYPNYGVGVDRL